VQPNALNKYLVPNYGLGRDGAADYEDYAEYQDFNELNSDVLDNKVNIF
jgi:hypothetical protein